MCPPPPPSSLCFSLFSFTQVTKGKHTRKQKNEKYGKIIHDFLEENMYICIGIAVVLYIDLSRYSVYIYICIYIYTISYYSIVLPRRTLFTFACLSISFILLDFRFKEGIETEYESYFILWSFLKLAFSLPP